jgi:hypothetical protein
MQLASQGSAISRHLGRWLQRGLPWVIGLALIPLLLYRIPIVELSAAIRHGPFLALSIFTGVHLVASWYSDAAATRVGLEAVGIGRDFREILWMRGATYLAGLLNFTIGQGAIAFHLTRTGVQGAFAAGATLLLVLVSFLALAALALTGSIFFAPFDAATRLTVAAAALTPLMTVVLLYLARPAWLTRRAVLQPIFQTGPTAHLRALAARLTHFAFVTGLYWGGMRLWGIELPFARGMVLIPLVLFVAALPLTPNGIGTVQVAQLLLFSDYSHGVTAAEREASILAFGLVQFAAAFVAQAAIGFRCLLKWQSMDSALRPQEGRLLE